MFERRAALLGRAPGRVLDLGCGNGDFLAALRRKGWQVHGTDLSEAAHALAGKRGIPVHNGELSGAKFPDQFFDVVTLWHVLEHLPCPTRELSEARRILRDDGLLVVEVPNMACFMSRLCGDRWFPLDVPRHLQHFTPATLELLLRRSGFTVVRRQNFHWVDPSGVLLSLLYRSGLLAHGRKPQHLKRDIGNARALTKALILGLAAPLGALSVAYASVSVRLTGSGESLTVTARKLTK